MTATTRRTRGGLGFLMTTSLIFCSSMSCTHEHNSKSDNPLFSIGTSDGGGGAGVRCPTTSSTIPFELLDLHEIKLKGEELADNPTTMEEAIELSAYKLGTHYYVPSKISSAPYIGYLKRNIVEKIFKGESFTNPVNGSLVKIEYVNDLPLADDIGSYQIKPGCSLEQAAYYFDETNTLKIVTSRWNELSWRDRSALVTHEIHYFLDRYNGLEDFGSQNKKMSMRARNFVGLLYSKTGVVPKYQPVPSIGKFVCTTNVDSSHRPTFFSIFSNGSNGFTAVFGSIQNHSSAYTTKAIFANTPLASLKDWLRGEMDETVDLQIATQESLPSFSVRITKAVRQEAKLQSYMIKNDIKIPIGAEEEIICWDPEN